MYGVLSMAGYMHCCRIKTTSAWDISRRMSRERLSEALGQQVVPASGLGAVDGTGDLRRHITELEQRGADSTEQLRDREDELNAARLRTANSWLNSIEGRQINDKTDI